MNRYFLPAVCLSLCICPMALAKHGHEHPPGDHMPHHSLEMLLGPGPEGGEHHRKRDLSKEEKARLDAAEKVLEGLAQDIEALEGELKSLEQHDKRKR